MATSPAPETDTIAAIATAAGPAGVGVLRVSGPGAFTVADRMLRRKTQNPVAAQEGHTLRRATVYEPQTGEPVDDGLLAVFHAPRSFTGEDVVEFQGHGGTVTLNRVLAAALRAGARAARPGEFSERAFRNGKLDLAQAEAIADLISAGTVAAQRAARRQLSGELSGAVLAVRDAIFEALALIEATIDFPEEVGEIEPERLDAPLARAAARIESLLATAAYGRRLREGITVVLTGRPNVGKSSLLNALSGTQRAIVTDIPGTTRDIVEEQLQLGGIPVRALDTAGLRETTDPVERIGVERARQAVRDADVAIVILDATAGLTDDDRHFLHTLPDGPPAVIAINKADTAAVAPLVEAVRLWVDVGIPVLGVSAVTGVGLAALTEAVAQTVSGSALPSEAVPLVTTARHENALRAAAESLHRARNTITAGLPPELIAVDSHAALASLGEITGETTREEIIAGIFSRFCIGK
ncbi:MAG: tRNA uridine-5-carboxymethylaminomethyl(34) synthesis GTPase MnmE [Armatimonadaceae bacterium]